MSQEASAGTEGSDNQLWARWERQIAPCRSKIHANFIRRGFLVQEADDLTQETLLRAWRYFTRIRIPQIACAYVLRVAATVMADYLGKKRRNRESTSLSASSEEERDRFERERLEPVFGDEPQNPLESLLQQERSHELFEALQEISERDRTILVLYYLEERSHAEIAEILGLSRENVKVAASRARQRLRARLEGNAAP
jgi:RNA polymerase sigma-70 factor (ECF subfamily)